MNVRKFHCGNIRAYAGVAQTLLGLLHSIQYMLSITSAKPGTFRVLGLRNWDEPAGAAFHPAVCSTLTLTLTLTLDISLVIHKALWGSWSAKSKLNSLEVAE